MWGWCTSLLFHAAVVRHNSSIAVTPTSHPTATHPPIDSGPLSQQGQALDGRGCCGGGSGNDLGADAAGRDARGQPVPVPQPRGDDDVRRSGLGRQDEDRGPGTGDDGSVSLGAEGVDLPWNVRVDRVNVRNTAANKNAMLNIKIHDVKWFYFTNP